MPRTPLVMVALLLIPLALPVRADDCTSEARLVDNLLRAEGGDPALQRRIDRAAIQCRDSPAAGLAELRGARREIELRALQPPRQQGFVPPPVGEPWYGAGPGLSPGD